MHKIKELLMDELYEYEDKVKKSGGKLSTGDLETLHKLTDTVKNIDKIEMLEEDGGYSEGGDWMGEGRMYGTSYRGGSSNGGGSSSYSQAGRGRGSNANRDSRGRYSSRGYSQNGYSYGDAAEEMIEKAQEMLSEAENEEQKRAVKQLIRKLENM